MRILSCILLALCMLASYADAAGMRLRYKRMDSVHGLLSGSGTAFAIDMGEFGIPGQRWVMTAAHNIQTDKILHNLIEIETKDRWIRCTVVAYVEADMCIMLAAEDLVDKVRFAADDIMPGQIVSMPASIKGGEIREYKGKFISHFFEGRAYSLMEIEFDHGASGAPVLDENGRLVGVAVAGLPGNETDIDKFKGLFLPISSIRTIIKSYIYSARH